MILTHSWKHDNFFTSTISRQRTRFYWNHSINTDFTFPYFAVFMLFWLAVHLQTVRVLSWFDITYKVHRNAKFLVTSFLCKHLKYHPPCLLRPPFLEFTVAYVFCWLCCTTSHADDIFTNNHFSGCKLYTHNVKQCREYFKLLKSK